MPRHVIPWGKRVTLIFWIAVGVTLALPLPAPFQTGWLGFALLCALAHVIEAALFFRKHGMARETLRAHLIPILLYGGFHLMGLKHADAAR